MILVQHAVLPDDDPLGIGEERERQVQPVAKAFRDMDRIGAQADHIGALSAELQGFFAQARQLRAASPSELPAVEDEDEFLTVPQPGQGHRPAVVVRRLEVGGLHADCERGGRPRARHDQTKNDSKTNRE